MEPCPYRQGEPRRTRAGTEASGCRNGALPLSAGRAGDITGTPGIVWEVPQWSPALIGRERV